MPVDVHTNFAYSIIVTPPAPTTTGLSLTVAAGTGGRFPTAPFNATVWPLGQVPTPLNAEIVRVTARVTDTLTITRAQEASTARAIAVGDQIAATITAKTLQDAEGWQLLAAASGASTSAGAATVATVAFGTAGVPLLGPLDTLRVYATFEAVTGDVTPSLYHVTDALSIGAWAAMLGSQHLFAHALMRNGQSTPNRLISNMGLSANVANTGSMSATTPWGNPWTLGLRHGGITASGTLRWSWAVHRLKGA